MFLECNRKVFYLFILSFILFTNKIIFSQQKTEKEYIDLGKEAYESKNYSQSIEYYKKAIELNPQNAEVYFNMAGVFLVSKKYDGFKENILKAIKLAPDKEGNYYFFGQGSAFMDESDEAIEACEALQDTNTNWGALCGGIAAAYERMGDFDNAMHYLGKGLITAKYAHQIYTQMGKLNFRFKGNYAEAFKLYKQALEYDSHYSKAYFEIGQLYGRQNEWENARINFEKAILYDSKYVSAYYNLSLCYRNLGEPLKSAEYMKKAAELGDEDAKKYLIENNIQ